MLEKILPRPLGSSGSDCASLITSLIMAAHFERSNARALGWRGVLASASEHPAWTCRVADSPHVFGMRFEGEEEDPAAACLRGYFSLFIFPQADDPILDSFPLAAMSVALSPGYEGALRAFTGGEAAFAPFRMGQLRMDAALDGSAFALTLEAPSRRIVIAADGIRAENGEWIVPPGGTECDVPAFRLFLRLFASLAASAEQQLGMAADIFLGTSASPAMCYDAAGHASPSPDRQERTYALTAAFGPSLTPAGETFRRLPRLPARHDPAKMERHDKPLLHVLTGFLGAGKTTFLRRWLDFLHGRERFTGVIQNEFGKVELDAALLRNETLVEALDDGCVCCSLADSLRPGLERIISAMPAEQFILETTGVADPGNVMDSLRKLRDLVVPGIVITVADALDMKGRDIAGVRLAQLHRADVIILNKCDLVSAGDLEVLEGRLARINDRALLLRAEDGGIPFALLDQWIDEHSSKKLPSRALVVALRGSAGPSGGDERFEARELDVAAPLTVKALEKIFLDAGPGLCRAKGIVPVEGMGNCVAQYAAGRLDLTPTDEERTPLVLIGTALQV